MATIGDDFSLLSGKIIWRTLQFFVTLQFDHF